MTGTHAKSDQEALFKELEAESRLIEQMKIKHRDGAWSYLQKFFVVWADAKGLTPGQREALKEAWGGWWDLDCDSFGSTCFQHVAAVENSFLGSTTSYYQGCYQRFAFGGSSGLDKPAKQKRTQMMRWVGFSRRA